jgi:acetyl-CoA/propionyl-CoA carboxylase biotin carboxyl carrier protein
MWIRGRLCEGSVVEALGNGRFVVSAAGIGDLGSGIRQGQLAYAASDKDRVWVFIDGRTYVIEEDDRDDRERVHATDDQMALSSPMPATVVAIKVAPGQEVAEGDPLVMLEAMKMELPIKAPRPGRVKSLACREGELVQPGVPLVELE